MLSSWFRGGGARRAFATHSGADDAAVAQFRLKYAVTALRERVVTEFQTLEVYATSDVGNLLVIDGDAQLSEADEAHYHEMLAHVAVAAASRAPDAELGALVVGRRPAARAAAPRSRFERHRRRHRCAGRRDLRPLVRDARPESRAGGGRLEVVVGDGCRWLEAAGARRFDVIIVDATDQDDGEATTASHPLYTRRFNELGRDALTNDGVFVRNFTSLAPYPLDHARRNAAAVCDAFDKVRPFCWFQPCFRSGHYSALLCARRWGDVVEDTRWAAPPGACAYYSPEVAKAAFVLPPGVRARLGALEPRIEGALPLRASIVAPGDVRPELLRAASAAG
ncbi:spermidine synthase [Aureococcus anophagefferens]|nr:spermidine synthase [Aureococcus anophagefferens]